MELLKLEALENYSLSLALFEIENAKAVVQIVHGMEEHKERYYSFAEFLNNNGYNVVVSDLRGHGVDAPKLSHIANKDGEKLLIDDQNRIYNFIKERFNNLPVILFGHSMGTIISRVLLQTKSMNYQKTVLTGYVAPNPASGIAVHLGNQARRFRGAEKKTKLLTNLALGPYTKAVKNRKTDLDWLSYNEENVNKYIEDPLCGVEFTNGSYSALFHLLKQMGKKKSYVELNKHMPILLAAGVDDPCTGGEKGRLNSKKILDQVGFSDISVITYPNMRHEILNETDKDKVYNDILEFLNK